MELEKSRKPPIFSFTALVEKLVFMAEHKMTPNAIQILKSPHPKFPMEIVEVAIFVVWFGQRIGMGQTPTTHNWSSRLGLGMTR